MVGVRPIGARDAGVVGVAKKMKIDQPPETSPVAQTQRRRLIPKAIVSDHATGIQPRERVGPAYISVQATPTSGEAPGGETPAFGLRGEMGWPFTSASNNVITP